MPSPLAGTLVVDLSRYLPGPFATRELVRLGARVVRLEAPSGDPVREIAPGWHAWLNEGKESVACDLKADPAFGRALCARADVVVEGFRPGVAARLGVGPDDVPGTTVYCSITGFGAGAPRGAATTSTTSAGRASSRPPRPRRRRCRSPIWRREG